MVQPLLRIARRTVHLHSAVSSPAFGASTVLAADPWEYVGLWLRREHSDDAVFYWDQAKQFFDASRHLSTTASPLTSYYAILNATKAFLTHKSALFAPEHGVARGPEPHGKVALKKEVIILKKGGVLAALCSTLHEPLSADEQWSLFDIFHNLPFIHRPFTLTFRSADDLFIPLTNEFFVRHPHTTDVWFAADVNPHYVGRQLAAQLPPEFEVDAGDTSGLRVRMKRRFQWVRKGAGSKDTSKLTAYHRDVRRHVVPIVEPLNRWYLRRKAAMPRSELPLIYAALHRLSELSRYEALRLRAHLEAQHNWLVAEFLRVAPAQFVHLLASEITGKEFLVPSAVRLV